MCRDYPGFAGFEVHTASNGREAGCDGFIAKPCLPEQLVAQLARFPVTDRPASRRKVR